jgi:hypothetical protein
MYAYNASDFASLSIVHDNIYAGNGGYGLTVNVTFPSHITRSNAFYNNASGPYNDSRIASSSDVILTADPFVDAANGDFNINNAAGGGAVLRSTKYTLGG